jgi:transcriptional regulator with XRE-family HTH domain
MSEFNKKEFGNKLRSARIKKELSLNYVGRMINKSPTTVGRYEKGEIVPNAKIINELCNLLEIYNMELFEESEEYLINTDNSKNPFKTNKLYLYYKGYSGKRTIAKFKFIIDITEKTKCVEIRISDYKNHKTILIGHMLADDNMVSLRTENYKPNCPRLETNQIIVNISEGTEGLLLGTMLCTNGNYVPNVKKCLISKKDLVFSNEMLNLLNCTDEEKNNYLKDSIWLVDIEKNNNYEIE